MPNAFSGEVPTGRNEEGRTRFTLISPPFVRLFHIGIPVTDLYNLKLCPLAILLLTNLHNTNTQQVSDLHMLFDPDVGETDFESSTIAAVSIFREQGSQFARKEYTYGTPIHVYAPRMKVIQTWVFRRCTLPVRSVNSNYRSKTICAFWMCYLLALTLITKYITVSLIENETLTFLTKVTIRPGFIGTVPIFNLKTQKKSQVSRDPGLSCFWPGVPDLFRLNGLLRDEHGNC